MRYELKLRIRSPLGLHIEKSYWTFRPSKSDVMDVVRRRQTDKVVVLAYSIDQIQTVEQVEL